MVFLFIVWAIVLSSLAAVIGYTCIGPTRDLQVVAKFHTLTEAESESNRLRQRGLRPLVHQDEDPLFIRLGMAFIKIDA